MTKKTYVLLLFFVFPFIKMSGQNLCTNGDFETYTLPPDNYAQICRATGWLSPSGICALIAGTGSPDYYSTLGTGGARPPATWWATVSPHAGAGMAGFVTAYPGSTANYREYVMRQLSSPLVIGTNYSISMWITNGISSLHQLGANNLGVAFSAAPLVQTLGTPIAYVPQCEMAAVLYSTTWTLVTFNYTATAAYQYVTIGNFRNDAATTMQSFGGTYGCYYYIDDIVIQPASALPVQWLNFSATNEHGNNILQWETASETRSDYFEVQKSVDSQLFSEIGNVKAAGNSTESNAYSFTDNKFDQSCYYRLKQFDVNGNFDYSKIIYSPLQFAAKDDWNIYTSESDLLYVEGLAEGETIVVIKIYNTAGQLVKEFPDIRIQSVFSEKYDLSYLRRGVYFVKILTGNRDFSRKIIIH